MYKGIVEDQSKLLENHEFSEKLNYVNNTQTCSNFLISYELEALFVGDDTAMMYAGVNIIPFDRLDEVVSPKTLQHIMSLKELVLKNPHPSFKVSYDIGGHICLLCTKIIGHKCDAEGRVVEVEGYAMDFNEKSVMTYHEDVNAMMFHQSDFERLFENSPLGMQFFDRAGTMVLSNIRATELTNIDSSLVGIYNILGDDMVNETIKDAVLSGVDFSMELPSYLKCDKNSMPEKRLGIHAKWMRNLGGVAEKLLVIINDKTELELSNKKVTEAQKSLDLLCDVAKVGVAHYNVITREAYSIQDQWFKNLGVEPSDDLSFDQMFCNVHPDDIVMFKKMREKQLNSVLYSKSIEPSLNMEMRVIVGGVTRWLKTHFLVEYSPEADGSLMMVGTTIDITELVESRDRATQSDKLKSQFLSNMSHEIRTPLNAILGFSNLICKDESCTSRERVEYMQIIEDSNDLLLQLISDILDLSKMEAGDMYVRKSMFSVKQFCQDVYQVALFKRKPEVAILLDDSHADVIMHTDRQRLMQAVINFVTNAIKFTIEGSVTLKYSADDKEVRVSVVDTGVGISAQQQAIIFRRFVKFNDNIAGTGLGMPISKQVADLLGGRVEIESVVGKGSTFSIVIPRY